MSEIIIGSITMLLNRKEIKNLHISVLPPDGKVRISAPEHMTETAIRMAVIHRIPWIKKQQREFGQQSRQSIREMINGESHYLWGKRYRLEVIERHGKHKLVIEHGRLRLYVQPGTTNKNRQQVVQKFYRDALMEKLPELMQEWCHKMALDIPSYQVRRMRTMWGSCNREKQRVLINSELAKKPIECLEYIIIHELTHLIERLHNDRFRDILDIYLPDWRERRALLQKMPLADENWVFNV
ncbi:M48 family metallopeptidase [Wohlfahrtiimonas chitiniclastica]|uniref:M48 family metallopeptidase n=1 Tax=Wohlfahrtiimonas chitiniclastica TaxID=400946 RepID=UPI000B996B66|nr:SprT family zinc-dependent metalloprotease [Wohlfahrtiimonas chitiniclastica]MBS7836291.1 M48 family metallopeptidase [Wohlfahrtiimonas chitiniclastica]OYQ89688.1 metal-dependent hydrolase [Wohlfahrtiimonas chitiniclastica]